MFSPAAAAHARGSMSILNGLIAIQREQHIATQAALRLGSLNFAVTARNTARTRKLESELDAVRRSAGEHRLELERLRAQLLDARKDAEQQHAQLRDASRTHDESLLALQELVRTYRAQLAVVEREQRSSDGMLHVGIVVLAAWVLSSPLVSLPLAFISALLRLLTGRRTRSASALTFALRVAVLGWLVARLRRACQQLGLLDARAESAAKHELARGIRLLLERLVADVLASFGARDSGRLASATLHARALVLAAAHSGRDALKDARARWAHRALPRPSAPDCAEEPLARVPVDGAGVRPNLDAAQLIAPTVADASRRAGVLANVAAPVARAAPLGAAPGARAQREAKAGAGGVASAADKSCEHGERAVDDKENCGIQR
ncbi:hypothetical protein KFE25_001554 [Diacronema lutheri]|uniref:Uncharacterized protein n=1 Tax=Diacronema lutheri TaxID=2081491 RepID=A0A8J5X8B3_DIALT|nr:hypothetical protein KFE25_001554 [Diacronema lutheri]